MPLLGASRPNVSTTARPCQPKPRLQQVGIDQLPIGHTVRNHHQLLGIRAIDAAQNIAAPFGHHHDLGGAAKQSFHHPTLIRARLFENGMQRHDHRQRRAVQQGEQVIARRSAVDAVFVLDPDRICAARLDHASRLDVRGPIILGDRAGDFGRILVPAGMVVHRIDVDGHLGEAVAQRSVGVGREGSEAAQAWQEVPDQRQASELTFLCLRRHHANPFCCRCPPLPRCSAPERTINPADGCIPAAVQQIESC